MTFQTECSKEVFSKNFNDNHDHIYSYKYALLCVFLIS